MHTSTSLCSNLKLRASAVSHEAKHPPTLERRRGIPLCPRLLEVSNPLVELHSGVEGRDLPVSTKSSGSGMGPMLDVGLGLKGVHVVVCNMCIIV